MDQLPRPRRMDALAKPSVPPPASKPDDALTISEITSRPQALATSPVKHGKPVFTYKKPTRRRFHFEVTKKKSAVILGIVVLAAGLFFVAKVVLATSRIITRNNNGGAPALAGSIDPSKLRGEGDGRVNILVMGIGGAGHAGGNLSDTMLVISLDPRTKDVAMLGLPRDMYVPIPGFGSTKINAANAYGESSKYPGGGAALAKKTVEKVLDIPIHYYVRIDFTGFKKAIDAVGGIDLVVDKALYDPQYPCDNDRGFCPYSITAGPHHLDGAAALKYSRCRHGSCGSDFGRAARQQQVLVALRQKGLSVPTLLNPAKVSSLIDAVGDHFKTDLSLSDIKKLTDIAKDVDTGKIVQKVLDTTPDGLLTDGNIAGAGYVEIPRAGIGNFSQIQELVHSIFVDSYIKDENATIEVQNGTTRNALAATVGAMLKAYKYNVVKMVTADNQNYPTTVIYDYSGGKKPYTIRYLENRLGVRAQKAKPPTPDATDIRIILGASYRATKP